MITQIIKLLQSDEWYGVSEEVEVAKGRYKIPKGMKEYLNAIKRDAKWRGSTRSK